MAGKELSASGRLTSPGAAREGAARRPRSTSAGRRAGDPSGAQLLKGRREEHVVGGKRPATRPPCGDAQSAPAVRFSCKVYLGHLSCPAPQARVSPTPSQRAPGDAFEPQELEHGRKAVSCEHRAEGGADARGGRHFTELIEAAAAAGQESPDSARRASSVSERKPRDFPLLPRVESGRMLGAQSRGPPLSYRPGTPHLPSPERPSRVVARARGAAARPSVCW